MICSVFSGKGGTGKDTMVANLSCYLAQCGKKVLLVDLDFGCCNLHYFFGEYPPFSIGEFVNHTKNMDEIKYQIDNNLWLITAEQGNQGLVDMSLHSLDSVAHAIRRQDRKHDFVFLNLSAGIHKSVMRMIHRSDVGLAVVTSDVSAVTDGYHIIRELIREGYNPGNIHLLVNQTKDESVARSAYSRINSVLKSHTGETIKYIGRVKKSDNVPLAFVQRQPLMKVFPRTKAARQISNIACILQALRKKQEVGNE